MSRPNYTVRLADKCGEFSVKGVKLDGHETLTGALEVFGDMVRRYSRNGIPGGNVDVMVVNTDCVDLGCPYGLSEVEEGLVEEYRITVLRGAPREAVSQ